MKNIVILLKNRHSALDAESPDTVQRSSEETPHQVRGDSASKRIAGQARNDGNK